MKKKKILLIWDFDGPIGQVNSTLPYNYNYEVVIRELDQIDYVIHKLAQYKIKSCFAITGFSGEDGELPFNFPDLIANIQQQGHEVASHSWKHEWFPFLSEKQAEKSLSRSKHTLQMAIENRQEVVGFVPPHNKPSTWIKRGAYSLEDKALWPMFKLGNLENIFELLLKTGYKWVRISHNSIFHKLGLKRKIITGRVYAYKGLLILENHYCGFDQKVRDLIESSDNEHFIVSAHPAMLAKPSNRDESSAQFELFMEQFANRNDIQFELPMNLV